MRRPWGIVVYGVGAGIYHASNAIGWNGGKSIGNGLMVTGAGITIGGLAIMALGAVALMIRSMSVIAPRGTPMPPNGGVMTQPNITGGLGPSQQGTGPFSTWIRWKPGGGILRGEWKPPGFDGPIPPKPPGPFNPPPSVN